MTLVKEVLDINWSEPFEINAPEDLIGQHYVTCLQKCFGHSGFRAMQWKVIASILHDRRDNCVIMATGYGKSLCYQFLSVFLDTITIVVSPLISLMEDQVLAMRFNNIRACFLGSAQVNRETLHEVIDRRYNIVYVTPEYITSECGEYLLNKILEDLTLIAVDEAHCISKWGHDFRSAYRNLSRLRDLCPNVPILAMTATATPRVRDDIIQSLKLRNAQIISTGFDRPNLEFAVEHKSDIWADIGPHIGSIKIGSVIVYCISRRVTEEVGSVIMAKGLPCGIYHAGLSLSQRKKTHEDFIHDRIRVICATIAFGMGINKPDVRLVIHYGVAKDVESYYQEVGRAGRDGLPSKCLMFYSSRDWITLSLIRNKCERPDTLEHQQKLTEVMRQYISSNVCRRRFILKYFEENCDELEPRLDCCDICKRQNSKQNLFHLYEGLCEDGLLDITDESLKLLTLVRAYNASFGLHKVLLVLKGSKSKSVPGQCVRHSLYGSLSGMSIKRLEAVGNYLCNVGMLLTVHKAGNGRSYPTCVITRKGLEQIVRGNPIRIVPTDEFIRLLKIKVKPKVKVAKPPDNRLSRSNGTPTASSNGLLSTPETPAIYDIYRPLLRVRTKLASLFDVMPYLVASTKALQQMATHQPTTMDEFRQLELDGYSEQKTERFGPVFLKVIRDFHAKIGKKMKEGASMSNTITRHLLVSDPNDRPSTSSHNLVVPKEEKKHTIELPEPPKPASNVTQNWIKTESSPSLQERDENLVANFQVSVEVIESSPSPVPDSLATETQVFPEGIKLELCWGPQEGDEVVVVSSQDSVEVIEPTPPSVIEISDSDTESEDRVSWESGLGDSELLQVGEEFDVVNPDSSSDSENEELDLLIAALRTDKLCPTQMNKRTENDENTESIPNAIREEQNVSSTCSRNQSPEIAFNQCTANADTLVSKNEPAEGKSDPISKCSHSVEIDSDLEMYWDSDVNDLDLTQISEKAEQELQNTSANIHPGRDETHRTENIPAHSSALPSLNYPLAEVKKEEDDLDLFLDEVKLDFNRNYPAREATKTHPSERSQRAKVNVRVIEKPANPFQYLEDSSSESDSDRPAVIRPRKRTLPSWMQLINKRNR